MNDFLKGLLGLKKDAPPAQPEPAAFVPVNELERLLVAAVDPLNRATFLHALSRADVFAAMEGAWRPEAEWGVVQPGEQVALLNVAAPGGRNAVAVFTSPERLFAYFGPEAAVLPAKGGAFLRMVAASGAYLNPETPYSIYWSSLQIAALLGKPVEWTLKNDAD